jgi:MFS family permease
MRSGHESDSDGGVGISRGLLAVMAVGSGIAVANLYYIQPLLADIGRTFAVSASAMGLVFTLAQLGFATGVLFFVPLGDIGDRRRLILVMLVGASISLAGVATSRSLPLIAVAMFFVGAFSVTPQMFVPFAAPWRPQRGRALGVVMSGLLLGILVPARPADLSGGRLSSAIASGVTLTLAVVTVTLRGASAPAGCYQRR